MDPYEDRRLSVDERAADLVRRLTLQEKAGLMFQPPVSGPPTGELADEQDVPHRPSAQRLISERKITHLNLHTLPPPREAARWINSLQERAEQSPHGIPITIYTDSRHSFVENWGASFRAEYFSAWPEPLGLAAIGDEDTVREFASIARSEYAAVGIRGALHPTIDLATEPRWARQYSTFGQEADLVSRLALAYLDGFEGSELDSQSVACIAKHFPGGGPQKDGEDPHFPYGREQVYPGDMFEYHLEPFRRVIERGVSAIMPYYGMPVGLVRNGVPIDEVGFGYNRQIITGLLREELGFEGVVCADWGLVTPSQIGDKTLPPRAWGVEHLDEIARVKRIIDAGVDQLGGELDPHWVVTLVQRGLVDESRIDESAQRLLRVKFQLGLFDDPYVDEDAAEQKVALREYVEAGHRAQARSATVLALDTDQITLPLAPLTRVYSSEVSDVALVNAGLVPVATPAEADLALIRRDAPYDPRDTYMLESSFHAGRLTFTEDEIDEITTVAASAPVLAVVHLDRPAVLTPLAAVAAGLVAVYGTSDEALLDALTGRIPPVGKLPFQLPGSAEAVAESRPDVPGDIADALFEFGFSVPEEEWNCIAGHTRVENKHAS
ncbi:glycoside hydrolase family 3 protein [Okibacterium endophyticum]